MKRFCLSTAMPLAVLILIPLIGCKSSPEKATGPDIEGEIDPIPEVSYPPDLKESVLSAVESANKFAFDFYGELRNTRKDNILFSPYSAFSALSMALAGARGDTEQEMVDALRLDNIEEALHPACGSLSSTLNRGEGSDYQLTVANRLWGAADYPFLESFTSTLGLHHGAGFQSTDFRSNPDGARNMINTWVEEETEEKIRDLLPPRSITPYTRLVLTNAIYFLADWLHQFEKTNTKTEPFYCGDGVESSVPLMYQNGRFRHSYEDGFQILEMKYKGEDLSMVVLLPDDPDGIAHLEAALSWPTYQEWMGKLHEKKVKVWFPRFKFNTGSFSLQGALGGLGMALPFSDSADFSGIVEGGGGLFISEVIQQAFIKVDEEGTEAAAATAVTISVTSVPIENRFRADHPFLYLIQDRVTGTVLFIGRFAIPAPPD